MPGLITEQTFYFTTSKLLQNATTAFITIHDICYERQVAKLLTKIMQVFHDEMFDNWTLLALSTYWYYWYWSIPTFLNRKKS